MDGKITFIFKDGSTRSGDLFLKARGMKQNGERPTHVDLLINDKMGAKELTRLADWISVIVVPALQK